MSAAAAAGAATDDPVQFANFLDEALAVYRAAANDPGARCSPRSRLS